VQKLNQYLSGEKGITLSIVNPSLFFIFFKLFENNNNFYDRPTLLQNLYFPSRFLVMGRCVHPPKQLMHFRPLFQIFPLFQKNFQSLGLCKFFTISLFSKRISTCVYSPKFPFLVIDYISNFSTTLFRQNLYIFPYFYISSPIFVQFMCFP